MYLVVYLVSLFSISVLFQEKLEDVVGVLGHRGHVKVSNSIDPHKQTQPLLPLIICSSNHVGIITFDGISAQNKGEQKQ